jgi:hypothetical protein
MKTPPPADQLYPEDFVQQFHNSHIYEEPSERGMLGCEMRHYAQGGAVLHNAISLTNPGKYATNAVNITKTLLKRP